MIFLYRFMNFEQRFTTFIHIHFDKLKEKGFSKKFEPSLFNPNISTFYSICNLELKNKERVKLAEPNNHHNG